MNNKKDNFDVIVVGAGHAGVEAALASARMGCSTALVTLRKDTIGFLSCNPAVGGIGKGQLVKEIDALGGEMARITDYAGIQFRILNASKGPAVRSSRAQVDRDLYIEYTQKVINNEKNLTVIEGAVIKLLCKNNVIYGVGLASGKDIFGKTVIISPGTFLNGRIYVGLNNFPGGRIGEKAVSELSTSLKELGLSILRFKTGTCARLDKRSIDFSQLRPQFGDENPIPFSFTTKNISREQVPCYVTYTNPTTHNIIRSGLDRSPLYTGVITGTGVRYCPSIEDKIVRFADRERHQIFLEPEGLNRIEIYPNGISTSLPEDVQIAMIHSIKGLEGAKPVCLGYGIEHDVVEPTQLYPTLETKQVKNFYCAGQINGTTGYEEAGAQGLIAGINAALRVKGKDELILNRSISYIGVLIDDLVTKGTAEPYRMFTSRVEYRLLLREDNADLRLSEIGYSVGLLGEERYLEVVGKREKIDETIKLFRKKRIKASDEINEKLAEKNISPLKTSITVEELLRRPGVTLDFIRTLTDISMDEEPEVLSQVQIQTKYAGYIERQSKDVKRFQDLERILIPNDIEYQFLSGLSREIQEKLTKIRPVSLGQASRISGVTPAAIMLLMVHLKKLQGAKRPQTGDRRQ